MIRASLFLFTATAAAAGSAYTVQVIQIPPSVGPAIAAGINSLGQETGSVVTNFGSHPIPPSSQAFIASPTGGAMIAQPRSWTVAAGLAINDAGQVAGEGGGNSPVAQAFVDSTSGAAPIPLPAGWVGASAQALNNAGQVAGTLYNGAASAAFIAAVSATGAVSGVTLIPLPAGWINGTAGGINNLGQVTGFATVGSATQAFIGNPSGTAAIPLPAGWQNSYGGSVNDSGQVAGNVATGLVDQAFIGNASGVFLIPLPPGASSAGVGNQAVTNSGAVVGSADNGGWIWDATNGTRLLSNLVPTGWNITEGISISASGLILAQGSLNGGPSQYIELVPAPPPGTPIPPTWLLAFSGLALLWLERRLPAKNNWFGPKNAGRAG
jgi:hypothetical protein